MLNKAEVYSMKTHTDFNKHTDMTQDDKIFRMSRNEAEEACLQSPISAWEILYRARQKYAFTEAQLGELEDIIKKQDKI